MNTCTVLLKETVNKQIAEPPKKTQTRVIEAITAPKRNPRPHGASKLKGGANSYRVRISDYRIVYEIHEKILTEFIFDVDHRKQVYK